MTPPSPIVGIIANPASGRDLRRLTAHAGLHSSTDKASVVQRLLAAFGATGIRHALLPPDMTGIAAAVLRASQTRQARDGHWPFLEFLDMPLRQSVEDTRLAARRMVERGVALIAVLGGDGTHKAVAAEVGDVPLLALSTGTNNAFPELREAAGAGLAGGLCASNRVPPEIGLRRNKRLLVREPRRGLCEWALVDVAVSPQPFIGARAISRAEDLAEVFVSFAEPHAIGLSALCGLWSPVSREEPHGAWMRLHPDARESLLVPLAPGLLVGCGVSAAGYLQPGVAHAPSLSSGTLALDGEREIEFSATDRPSITLDPSGPFSVDVPATLAYAARHRLLAGQRTPMTREDNLENNKMSTLSTDQLLHAYRVMRTIRAFEERLHVEFATGEIPGFVHLYAGEEASAAGVMAHLRDDDCIASTHRGHGHCIAKGVDVHGMMAEIYGKKTGVCQGKGGSMHIADLEKGMLGANGIVGAGAPLAAGAALAAKLKGSDAVAVAFFGDGGSNEGAVFEAMNLAAVWNLPCLFVAENNGYAEATAANWSVACDHIADRAAGFGMPGVTVDGFDFFAVHEAAGAAIERARAGEGPSLIEVKLTRYYGHFEGDAQTYRDPDEVKHYRETRDCLKQFRERTCHAGLLSASDLDAIDAEVEARIEDAVQRAKNDPKPEPDDLLRDVYVSYP